MIQRRGYDTSLWVQTTRTCPDDHLFALGTPLATAAIFLDFWCLAFSITVLDVL